MPKIVDHDRRRREIATVALGVIRKQGLENASMRSIAEAGGLSLGVLTHYFTTKDELVVFTFRWLADNSFRQLDRVIERHRPGLARLEAALATMFPQAGEPAALALWMSLWDRAIRNRLFAREHRLYYRRWRGYVSDLLTDAVKRKQLSPSLDVKLATELLVAAVDGLWLTMTLEPHRLSASQRRLILKKLIRKVTERGDP